MLSACVWPAASTVTAAKSQAKTRVIILPREIKRCCQTGHTGTGFASNEPVTAIIFGPRG
jgi:hypothetical protein